MPYRIVTATVLLLAGIALVAEVSPGVAEAPPEAPETTTDGLETPYPAVTSQGKFLFTTKERHHRRRVENVK